MLLQTNEDVSQNLVQQLSKLNLTEDQLQVLSQLNKQPNQVAP